MKPVIEDASSIEWMRVKSYCEDRLQELRISNDDDQDAIQTARLRGMIEFAKEVCALYEDPSAPVNVPDTNYIS